MSRQPNNPIIRHRFGGGWAPDFGPTAEVQVGPDGGVTIPYLVNAENVFYELDGGPHKEYGTTRLGSQLPGSTNVKLIYDFWRQGTSGSPTQKRLVFHSTVILKDDADGSFSNIHTGLTAGAVPHVSQFDDFAILANDVAADGVYSYDGTTFQALAGTPPAFSFSCVHSNHLFAAGVHANPSTMYFSAPADPETWSGGGAGSFVVNPNDGDRIVGMTSYKQRLVIFKGPYKGSIHILSGTSAWDFSKDALVNDGIGAVWQNSIAKYRDDVAFLWSDGHIYSLAATDRFGDLTQAGRLTAPIDTFLTERVNFDRLRHAWLVNWPSRGILLAAYPIDNSNHPNFVLMIDYRFDPPRLSPWTDFDHLTCLALVRDPTASDRPIVMAGSSDGRIYKLGQPTRTLEGGTSALNFEVTTPFMHYGSPLYTKVLQHLALGVEPKNDSSITVGWTNDNRTEKTTTVTQGAGDTLGDDDGQTETGEFVLDTSALSGARYVDRFIDTHNGGEFRSIQFRVAHSGNEQDMALHTLTASMTIGGVSLENE